ncbi:MAG: DHH family phosphoesterase [Actinomycetia bacterium]|nr:DHH family phosphoesterase [Actinomycetes bacterium]
MSTVYVFGHKHPDNDSICSAVGAAYFLNMTDGDGNEYIPARLGPLPRETAWVFERFGAADQLPDELPAFDDPHDLSCVLVDHNEVAQSWDGIEETDLRMVIDHHRIGDIQTAGPITFINKPLGSTATITVLEFQHAHVEMPDWLAGVLFSAMLTDMVILKSPTTTDADRRLAAELAERLGLDIVEFGMELFNMRQKDVEFDPDRILLEDLKEYEAGGIRIAIGAYESVSLDLVEKHRDTIYKAMGPLATENGWGLFLFMASDVIKEGTELFVVGMTGTVELVEKAFDADFSSGSAWLPGVLSRKKQVAAAILKAAGEEDH